MGRRSQTDTSERRTATVTVQLTPSERADLDARVAAGGVRLSDYARAALLGFSITKTEPVDAAALRELWAAGNNLNQLARHANATAELDTQALNDALRLWCRAVERLGE
jgi:hypothetical protein